MKNTVLRLSLLAALCLSGATCGSTVAARSPRALRAVSAATSGRVALVPYGAPAGLFTLAAPGGWLRDEVESPARTAWIAPDRSARLSLSLMDLPTTADATALRRAAAALVPANTLYSIQQLVSGDVLVWWVSGNARGGRARTHVLLRATGARLATLSLTFPAPLASQYAPLLAQIAATLSVDGWVVLGATGPQARQVRFGPDPGAWLPAVSGDVSATAAGAVLEIGLLARERFVVATPPLPTSGDTRALVRLTPQAGVRAGLVVRASGQGPQQQFYACWLDATQQVGCFAALGDRWETLLPPTHSNAVQPAARNTMVLTAEGDQLQLTINDTPVATIVDARLATGVAGIYLENFATSAGATFTDLRITTRT